MENYSVDDVVGYEDDALRASCLDSSDLAV
jgi:hypothetical protein